MFGKRSNLGFMGVLGGDEELHLAVLSSGNSQRDVCLQVEMFLAPDVDFTCPKQPENRSTVCYNLVGVTPRSSPTFYYVVGLLKSRLQVSILDGSNWLVEGLGGYGLLSIDSFELFSGSLASSPSTLTR